jgi:phosphatidylglycerol---prolipoprotein diacylglyceryl transferase
MREGGACGSGGMLLPSPLLMMLATYVHDLSPFVIRFGESFGIRWYGLAYVASFLIGYLLYLRLARMGYSDLTPSQVGDFITITALFGVIVGGRLGYVLFYRFDEYLHDPISIFKLNQGGMSSHGGILGIAIFLSIYSRWLKVSWTNLGDNLVCVAPVGLFLVRCANFINGELYGRITSVPWAMKFPLELVERPSPEAMRLFPSTDLRTAMVEKSYADPAFREQVAPYLELRHPSQLYEAFFEGAVLFLILWILRTRFRLPNGVLTGAFFILYAIFRIGCEVFREPDAPLAGPFTRGQFLSLFMIAIGVGFLISAFRRNEFPHPPKTTK